MKIGFLGLGNMREPIAVNLIAVGHEVTVWNRTASKAEPLVKKGAKLAKDIADAGRHEVVCTMVADDDALRKILDGGLLDSLPKGGLHISLSTISVGMAEELKKRHNDKQQFYLSAPVFGRPDAAAAKKLWVVVAGDAKAIATARPVFDAISQQTVEIGNDPVQANVTKISGNFLIAAAMEGMGGGCRPGRQVRRRSSEVHGVLDQHALRGADLQELRHEDRTGGI